MKNRILKGLAPFGMFALAIAGTFMTTSMGSADALVFGYIQTGNPAAPCQQTSVLCSTNINSEYCRVGSTLLYHLTAPNVCIVPLWRVE